MKRQYTQKLSRPEPIPNRHGDASRGARQAIGSVGKRELACSKGTSYKGAMLAFSIAADPRRKWFFQSVVHGGRNRRCKAQCDSKCSEIERNILYMTGSVWNTVSTYRIAHTFSQQGVQKL